MYPDRGTFLIPLQLMMIGENPISQPTVAAGWEQEMEQELKWILNYSRKFLKKRFSSFIIQHHKESLEKYEKNACFIEGDTDEQSNVEVLIPESLFFVRRVTECLDRLSSEDSAKGSGNNEGRSPEAEGCPLEGSELTRRLRMYEASLSRLESVYIEQKAMEDFIGMISDIPPTISNAKAVSKSETLIVDTRNIFESRQEALVYLEKDLQGLLELLHSTYHKLISLCFEALDAFNEREELMLEHRKLVAKMDAMEDPEIGRLLSRIDSYDKLIEEFEIKSSNFESSLEIKRGMITEVKLSLDKSKKEYQRKKKLLEDAKRVCENFDPKIPKLISW